MTIIKLSILAFLIVAIGILLYYIFDCARDKEWWRVITGIVFLGLAILDICIIVFLHR